MNKCRKAKIELAHHPILHAKENAYHSSSYRCECSCGWSWMIVGTVAWNGSADLAYLAYNEYHISIVDPEGYLAWKNKWTV